MIRIESPGDGGKPPRLESMFPPGTFDTTTAVARGNLALQITPLSKSSSTCFIQGDLCFVSKMEAVFIFWLGFFEGDIRGVTVDTFQKTQIAY